MDAPHPGTAAPPGAELELYAAPGGGAALAGWEAWNFLRWLGVGGAPAAWGVCAAAAPHGALAVLLDGEAFWCDGGSDRLRRTPLFGAPDARIPALRGLLGVPAAPVPPEGPEGSVKLSEVLRALERAWGGVASRGGLPGSPPGRHPLRGDVLRYLLSREVPWGALGGVRWEPWGTAHLGVRAYCRAPEQCGRAQHALVAAEVFARRRWGPDWAYRRPPWTQQPPGELYAARAARALRPLVGGVALALRRAASSEDSPRAGAVLLWGGGAGGLHWHRAAGALPPGPSGAGPMIPDPEGEWEGHPLPAERPRGPAAKLGPAELAGALQRLLCWAGADPADCEHFAGCYAASPSVYWEPLAA